MWLSGVLLLICHYQIVSASKTIMTNEISMPSLGHKEKIATFHRLQAKEILPIRYRSARFERLRATPEDIKPVFVKPAFVEIEQPNFVSQQPAPIEVVPSSETVTEIPMETVAPSDETPVEPFEIPTEIVSELPTVRTIPIKTIAPSDETPVEPSEIPTEIVSELPTVRTYTFEEIPVETTKTSFSESPTVEVSPNFPETETTQTLVQTSEGPISETASSPQELVYPTAISVAPAIEFVEVPPSSQVEVSSTNVIEMEETITTSTKAPRKRRHRRKHRKLRKTTKVTEFPTELPTEAATEMSIEDSTQAQTEALPVVPSQFPIEVPTEVITTFELPTEPQTQPSTAPPTTTTESTTVASTVTTESPTAPPAFQTFPTFGSTGVKVGESYLGGWNEDEGVIVTTSGPSLGSAMNQFSEIPESIPINDDEAIKAYYEKYYAEWYQRHNQALAAVSSVSTVPNGITSAPREIKIGLVKKQTGTESTTQSFGIPSSTAKPTKEQLDKVCDYVAKISKSFGIKDLEGFAKNNCAFVQSFHPASTCEQIQHLMKYCVTGILVNQ